MMTALEERLSALGYLKYATEEQQENFWQWCTKNFATTEERCTVIDMVHAKQQQMATEECDNTQMTTEEMYAALGERTAALGDLRKATTQQVNDLLAWCTEYVAVAERNNVADMLYAAGLRGDICDN